MNAEDIYVSFKTEKGTDWLWGTWKSRFQFSFEWRWDTISSCKLWLCFGWLLMFRWAVVRIRISCKRSQLQLIWGRFLYDSTSLCAEAYYMLTCSSNLLHRLLELHWLLEWTRVQNRCCWNDLVYQTDGCLFCKTAVWEAVRVSAGTNWDRRPLLYWLCSSERPSLPHRQTLSQETESQLDSLLILRKMSDISNVNMQL